MWVLDYMGLTRPLKNNKSNDIFNEGQPIFGLNNCLEIYN